MPERDSDSRAAVERDGIAGAGERTADRVVRGAGVDRDAVPGIAEQVRAVRNWCR